MRKNSKPDMLKDNHLILGVAIGFLALAVIQIFNATLFPISIYMYVACASFELTLLELIKTILNHIKAFHLRGIAIAQDEIDLCKRHIEVLSHFDALKADVEQYKRSGNELKEKIKQQRKEKRIIILECVINVLSIFQVAFLLVQAVLLFVYPVPNTVITNKIIGIISLLSFAFLAFSFYLNRDAAKKQIESKEKIADADALIHYYLNLFEKAKKIEEDSK